MAGTAFNLRHALIALCLAIGLAWSMAASAAPARAANIAAASDLQFALPEIARRFTQETGLEVQLTFGSSGNFMRQIVQGAPFEMFLSADEAFVRELARHGRTEGEGDLYATGRIVLFAPAGSPLEPDLDMAHLEAALRDGRVRRFAIANPEHAPYGRAAEEALRHRGLWQAVEPKLVLGENVSQAAQFATSGAAQGGIFAYSLALSPAIRARGRFVIIPEIWHAPLRQRMVLIESAGETARRFYAYLQQPAARAVLREYGFALPDPAAM